MKHPFLLRSYTDPCLGMNWDPLQNFAPVTAAFAQSFGWIRAEPEKEDAGVPTPAEFIEGASLFARFVQQIHLHPLEVFVHETQCISQLGSSLLGQEAQLFLSCVTFGFSGTCPSNLKCYSLEFQVRFMWGWDYPKAFFLVCERHFLCRGIEQTLALLTVCSLLQGKEQGIQAALWDSFFGVRPWSFDRLPRIVLRCEEVELAEASLATEDLRSSHSPMHRCMFH